MKRYGHLFEQLIDENNLFYAHENARRGKTHYREVQAFDADPLNHVYAIQRMLDNETYEVGKYDIITKRVDSGKIREIYRLDYFPHRVIHHAMIQVVEEPWTRTLIPNTYCCIKGRGIHLAGEKIKKHLKEDPEGTKYCLKIDIRKYYPSIDHGIMKGIVRRKIKDPKFLRLLDKIIDSAPGLPIGNYLSQYLANLYLSPLDHYCKEGLALKDYHRYCDDIVILHSDKAHLHGMNVIMGDYLREIKLDIKDNWQVFPVAERGIDFLGYRYFHGYTLIRKRIARKALRLAAKLRKLSSISKQQFQSITSYLGWFLHANALNLYNAVFDDRIQYLVAEFAHREGIHNPLEGRIR